MSRNEPLYEPLGWALLRAPLLSTDAYAELTASARGLDHLVEDDRVRAALYVASDSIAGALHRPSGSDKDARRLRAGLLRYLIRMSTRPTPYGLCAGVGLVGFRGRTDAVLGDGWRTRARVDMGRLLDLVMDLESRSPVRRRLCFFVNPCAYELSGRVHVPGTEPGPARTDPVAVSVRATAPVRAVLAAARRPVRYEQLVEAILALPGATPAKAHSLLDSLWEQSVLLTDLRPPPTTTDPVRYVRKRLTAVPEAGPDLRRLETLTQALRAWDDLPLQRKADGYAGVTEAAAPLGEQPPGIQADLALDVRGGITGAVARDAVTAAETLLRLTSWPSGPARLHAYRQAFAHRYADGEVPLLELLDERIGLGPVSRHGADAAAQPVDEGRRRLLRTMAAEAIRDGRRTVVLDEETLRSMQTWAGPEGDAPYSLDVSLFVLASSREALDAGDYRLLVGPNVGAPGAGRNTGRFADLLGPAAEAALAEAARRESALTPGAVWAEVSYLPARFRMTNVTVRPLVRDAEIAVGTQGAATNVIRPDDLLVGIRDGRLVLRWSRTGQEVVPCAGHMLNAGTAPAVCRFLDEIRYDLRPQLGVFDWGPAAGLPFLPRVEYGRVILTPAQWQPPTGTWPADGFADALKSWREAWHVPRHGYLTVADNRLLLDLDDASHADLLRRESSAHPVVLQEALPALDHAWLPGPDGPRVVELVVPLIRRSADPPRHPEPVAPAVQVTDRLRTVGSDWLYLKLYGPADQADRLLSRQVLPFSEFAVHAGLAAAWFFVRYADPEPHVRLRLRGEPPALLRRLLPEVVAWAGELLSDGEVHRWCFGTYEREVERYGGLAGIQVAEDIAAVDSAAVGHLLSLDPLPVDRLVLAVRTVDDLLAARGLDAGARRRWCGASEAARRSSADAYRRLRGVLHEVMHDPSQLPRLPNGAAAAGILAARRAALERIAGPRTSKPLEQLSESYVHMHCNRLLASGDDEAVVIGLLKRVLDSAAHRR